MFAYSDHLGTCSAASGSAAKVAALTELLEISPDVEHARRLMWLGFESQKKRHSWIGSLPCSARFFTGTPIFPSPQTSTFLNYHSIYNGRRRTTSWNFNHEWNHYLLFILKSGQGVIYVPFGSVSLDEVPGNRRLWRFTSYTPIPLSRVFSLPKFKET